MKSLMTFVSFIVFNFLNFSQAAEFACPLSETYANYTCSGTVRVQSMEQLNAYKNNLGIVGTNSTVAKALLIDFNPNLTDEISISTPCAIKTSLNIEITTDKNVCLFSKKGILIEDGFHFNGQNLKLESLEGVIINKNSVINAKEIRLLSIGQNDVNQAFIRDGAQINATNLVIESLNKGFLGRNSLVSLSGTLGIYSQGDEESSIREGAKVEAYKIDIQSTIKTSIANLTTLIASEINLNGLQGCSINKGSIITATDRKGNCFLTSLTSEKFSIDKNNGTSPLTVTFNANSISEATGYVWNFGDGHTESTLEPTITHTYSTAGKFIASLMYATQENFKVQKSAGFVQIDVKSPPIVTTTPPRGYFKYSQDGTFVSLKAFIRRTQFDILKAYYVIDDNQNNKINITNFYANSQSSVELNTFGQHKITMYVEDVQGQKYNTTMIVNIVNDREDIAPIIRFYGEESSLRTLFLNMDASFVPEPDEYLKNFTVDFGDGHSQNVEGKLGVTHTYAQAGTYNVKVSAEYNGNVRSVTQQMTVTNICKPAVYPVAGFNYYQFDFAGNLILTDESSSTPNGEIISYEWDFGNGMIAYGNQASHFFSPGNHLIKLTVTDSSGLRSSQTQLIKIEEAGENLVAVIDCWQEYSKALSCDVFALDEADQITRVKVEWGDNTSKVLTEPEVESWGYFHQEHLYSNAGTYNVKLTVNTSRGQTKNYFLQKEVTSYSAPISNPVASISCSSSNLLVVCNGLGSFDPLGKPLNYIFEYGDGFVDNNSSGVSSHSYLNSGMYSVKLKVKTLDNRENIAYAQVSVMSAPQNMLPIAQINCFSIESLILRCSGLGSIDEDGFLISYKYTWDDGVIDTSGMGSEVFHIFSTGGIHNVTLTVTDNLGAQNSKTIQVQVKENLPPLAFINCSSGGPQRISCISNSYDPDINDVIKEYRWEMGDGTVYTTYTPYIEHLYSLASVYTVKLIVKDVMGATSSTTQNISVIENIAPVGSISCSQHLGVTYKCNAIASDVDGTVVEFKWMVDGHSFSDESIMFDLLNGGNYSVSLLIKDNLGKTTTIYESIKVDAPVAQFECIEKSPLLIKCNYQPTVGDTKSIVQFRYEIDDKDVYTQESIEHSFLSSGSHKIVLYLMAGDGSTSQVSKNILVQAGYNPPKATFKTFVDVENNVKFNASESFLLDRKISNFQWTFGDGESANTNEGHINHSYTNIGFYNVKLTVTDNVGQINTVEKMLYVYDAEVPDPGPSNDDTLAGVDYDANGVRDDVQRWINFESQGNANLKVLLNKLVLNINQQFISSSNVSVAIAKENENNKIRSCISGKVNDQERFIKLESVINYLFTNTEERSKKWSLVQGNLSGTSTDLPDENLDVRLSSCEGLL